MNRKMTLFLVMMLANTLMLTAQQSNNQSTKIGYDRAGIVYSDEFSMDFQLHTNGYAFATNFGKLKTYYKTRFYHFGIGEIRHPKEFRNSTQGNFVRSFASYRYGKQNNFFVLRGGIGEKRYLSEKDRYKGIAVGLVYEAGASIGILKPYYLRVRSTTAGEFNVSRDTRYSEETATSFLDPTLIEGASGFIVGWKDLKIAPGGHAQAGLHFASGAYDEFVRALEVGVMIDFYFQNLPIMVDNTDAPTNILPENVRNRPFFLNLYVNLQLGKRW